MISAERCLDDMSKVISCFPARRHVWKTELYTDRTIIRLWCRRLCSPITTCRSSSPPPRSSSMPPGRKGFLAFFMEDCAGSALAAALLRTGAGRAQNAVNHLKEFADEERLGQITGRAE